MRLRGFCEFSRRATKHFEMISDIPDIRAPEVRINCPDEKKFDVVASLRDKAFEEYEAITVDGVRILYPEGWD